MRKLLLDEHLSLEVATGVQRRNRSLVIHSMVQWESGNFLGKEDFVGLLEAARQRLALVTDDRRTIPPLLKLGAEEERPHGGVSGRNGLDQPSVLLAERTLIRQRDHGTNCERLLAFRVRRQKPARLYAGCGGN